MEESSNVLTGIDDKTDAESKTQLFDARYKEFLNNSGGHGASLLLNPSQHNVNMQPRPALITLKDLNLTLSSVNSDNDWDMVHSENLNLGGW